MAKGTIKNSISLRDWIILIFVLVVMSLLILDIAGNVKQILDRNQELEQVGPVPSSGG